MGHRDDEEGVAAVCDTGQGVVPGNECSKNAKDATSLDAGSVGSSGVVLQVSNAKHQECHVKSEEEGEEGDSRAERADQQQKGKDEPALSNGQYMVGARAMTSTHHEVEAERVVKGAGARSLEGRGNLETAGGKDNGSANPKATVRRKRSSTKGVAHGHFPVRLSAAISRRGYVSCTYHMPARS